MFLILPAGFKREKSGISFFEAKAKFGDRQDGRRRSSMVSPARHGKRKEGAVQQDCEAMPGKVVTVRSPRKGTVERLAQHLLHAVLIQRGKPGKANSHEHQEIARRRRVRAKTQIGLRRAP